MPGDTPKDVGKDGSPSWAHPLDSPIFAAAYGKIYKIRHTGDVEWKDLPLRFYPYDLSPATNLLRPIPYDLSPETYSLRPISHDEHIGSDQLVNSITSSIGRIRTG